MNTNNKLWDWFSISRSSWLTIPRVLMHEMPEEWQNKMAELLDEYDNTFINKPYVTTHVLLKDIETKRYIKTPEWLLNYRHPDMEEINKLKEYKD